MASRVLLNWLLTLSNAPINGLPQDGGGGGGGGNPREI